jgi:hypothetical protein
MLASDLNVAASMITNLLTALNSVHWFHYGQLLRERANNIIQSAATITYILW